MDDTLSEKCNFLEEHPCMFVSEGNELTTILIMDIHQTPFFKEDLMEDEILIQLVDMDEGELQILELILIHCMLVSLWLDEGEEVVGELMVLVEKEGEQQEL
jgi:hypothetical protein